MEVTIEHVQAAIQHFKESIGQTRLLLEEALQAHLSTMLDEADAHPNYEGTFAQPLKAIRLKIEAFENQVSDFEEQLNSFVALGSLPAENETPEQLLQRMKEKGEAAASLSKLHHAIAEATQVQALVYKEVQELNKKVISSKSDASLAALKKKMGLE